MPLSAGCRHHLRRRIDNRAALKVRRMVSARQRLILRQVSELEAQYVGDQFHQVLSRPDQGAVVAHPSTLVDIEPKRNVLHRVRGSRVACLPSRLLILSQSRLGYSGSCWASISLSTASGATSFVTSLISGSVFASAPRRSAMVVTSPVSFVSSCSVSRLMCRSRSARLSAAAAMRF